MKVLKFALAGVPICVGGYYAYNHVGLFGPSKVAQEKLSDINFSDAYLELIKQKDLVRPPFYEKIRNQSHYRNFFFGSVLQQLQGVDEFGVYLEKTFNDVVCEKITVTAEEKEKLYKDARLYCIFVPNTKVQGHERIVHGGFTATLFDNMAGALAFMLGEFTPAATAYLKVTYKKPVRTGEEYHCEIYPQKMEGRKMFLHGELKDAQGNLYAEAELLFVKVGWKNVIGDFLKKITFDSSTPTAEEKPKEKSNSLAS